MKKFAAVIAVMALCSAPVMAAEQGGFSGPSATQSQAGGFQGPNGSVTTVESAKSLRDDTWVTLRGNIVERISDDLYVFKDASGTINVDIDHKRWNGVTVTPKDTVEIQGEVDAPRDKCAHFREINGIAAAFQHLQKNYIPAALSFL